MKVISKALEAIGFVLVMLGGSAMDNPSLIVPIILVLGGMGIMTAGMEVENEYI